MNKPAELSAAEYLTDRLRKRWSKFDSFVFLTAFALAMLVHMYMFMHKFINHDDVGGLYSDGSFGLGSGRWLLHRMTAFTWNISNPWINGIGGALYLAVAVVLVVRMLGMRSRLTVVLSAVCLVAFPVVASTYAYMFCAPQYLFALAASTAGAYMIRKERLGWLLGGAAAICLSMGCYQAYFPWAATLLVMLLILDLLDDRFGDRWKALLLTALKYLGALALGLILYFMILKICLAVSGTQLVSYQGIDSMGQLTWPQLVERVGKAYDGFWAFCMDDAGLFQSFFAELILLEVGMVLFAIVWQIVTRRIYRRPMQLICLIGLLVIFPLACCLVYVMSAPETVHLLMLYPLVMLLILPALLLERMKLSTRTESEKQRFVQRLKLLFMAVLFVMQLVFGYECVMTTNTAYFSLNMTYENAMAFYTKLATRIESHPEYTRDTPISFIGYAHMDTYMPQMDMQGIITGNEALNIYTIDHFLRYFLGTGYKFAADEKVSKLQQTQEYAQMPRYPQEGSIAEIDGILVVKFS